MHSFKEYLVEQQDKPPEDRKKVKYIPHVEDHSFYRGHDGIAISAQHLEDFHDKLHGKNKSFHVSTKFDGAPSVVFGQHPENGQFFVSTKGAFNKTSKVAFSHEDIDKHFGENPDLAKKMRHAFDHLPKIMPKKGGVYQGDLMYIKSDIKNKGKMYHFTPNTLTYSTPHNSEHGRAIRNSKLGIVVHTHYRGGNDLSSMTAVPLSDGHRDKFDKHPHVHNINPVIKINPSNYTPEEQKAFLNHMENARRTYSSMKPESMETIDGHGPNLRQHVNSMVRSGGVPSVDGYMDYLSERHKKDIDKLKTQTAKDRKIRAHAAELKHVSDHRQHFEKLLQTHGHLQNAKNILIDVVGKNSDFTHSINGKKSGPEGAVGIDGQGNMSKFVQRGKDGFAMMNLNNDKFKKKEKQKND